MTNANDNSDRTEVVFVGPCHFDGKAADLWIRADVFAALDSADEARKRASAFAADKKRPSVGGVYLAKAEAEGGRIRSLGVAKEWIRQSDSPIVATLLAIRDGERAREAARKAEAKAAKEAGPCEDAIDALAAVVADAPFESAELILQGFALRIRKRSHDLWRERQRRGAAK